MRTFLALILFLSSSQCWAATAQLTGAWTGEWMKAGDSVAVAMSFERDGRTWTGEFESDQLQAAGIPITVIRTAGNHVHFEVKGDSTTMAFDGAIGATDLSGTFSEEGTSGQFRFTRVKHPPAPLEPKEVNFRDGEVTLAGSLFLPQSRGRHPAILFLQGSGPEGRWANRWLAQKFVRSGFAALIYDKRGVGRSTGDWRSEGFSVLGADGAAGVRFLQALPVIDPGKVGIYGHSQGGSIAPLVAHDVGNLAFIIASAAPGLNPAEVESYSLKNSIGFNSLPEKERGDAEEYLSAFIDVAYHQAPRTKLDALAERFKARSWFFAAPPSDNPYWKLSRAIAQFDPSVAWARVKAPVLLVYGARDERVPALASLAAIRTTLLRGGNPNVSTKLYPDADHNFTIVAAEHLGNWPKRESDYAETLIGWATQIVDGRTYRSRARHARNRPDGPNVPRGD